MLRALKNEIPTKVRKTQNIHSFEKSSEKQIPLSKIECRSRLSHFAANLVDGRGEAFSLLRLEAVTFEGLEPFPVFDFTEDAFFRERPDFAFF